MAKTALLVVDVQKAMVQNHPFCQATLMECLAYLTYTCRIDKGIEVIYIRHDDGPGTDMETGSDGWQIDEQVRPDYDTERIFDKNYNSSFKDTGLHEYLQGQGVDSLIIAGMQTELCVDATVKAAFELGYTLYIPSEAVSTYDNTLLTAETINQFFLEHIWSGRYATVMDAKELMAQL